MEAINSIMDTVNGVLWHNYVLYILLGVGILFTLWSKFSQFRALTHGFAVIRGKYDKKNDPGAINHFQALSAALSATVGLGNIGGVAIAISLGGPGAVFWMWVVGLLGMAIKTTEVTQSMLYRNTDDPDNPHGGPMWVASQGLEKIHPSLKFLGSVIGGIFCVTLLISTVTGGNMFQAWNVGALTQTYFGVPSIATGILLSVIVGAVIIGGIKRIGSVAGKLVPFMVAVYLLAAFYVLALNFSEIPAMLALIIKSAFNPVEAQGAFIGAGAGIAFLWGMKRALFSNEAGQGSAPIAHSAAKTDEPVREGVVAGLEPFIDTILVCTLTALVILLSGAWNRPAESQLAETSVLTEIAANQWSISDSVLPAKSPHAARVSGQWRESDQLFVLVDVNGERQRLAGEVVSTENQLEVKWEEIESSAAPKLIEPGIYAAYPAAALTSFAFDSVTPGLGAFLVPLAAWLFAISTMISWSYYGEQGMIYLFGQRSVLPYKIVYCLLIVIACSGFIKTTTQLDNLTGLGTGVMLFANIPIMLIFGRQAMKAYHSYIDKLKAGKFKPHEATKFIDLVD